MGNLNLLITNFHWQFHWQSKTTEHAGCTDNTKIRKDHFRVDWRCPGRVIIWWPVKSSHVRGQPVRENVILVLKVCL